MSEVKVNFNPSVHCHTYVVLSPNDITFGNFVDCESVVSRHMYNASNIQYTLDTTGCSRFLPTTKVFSVTVYIRSSCFAVHICARLFYVYKDDRRKKKL